MEMESGLVQCIGAVRDERDGMVLVSFGETSVWLPKAEVTPIPFDDGD